MFLSFSLQDMNPIEIHLSLLVDTLIIVLQIRTRGRQEILSDDIEYPAVEGA